MIKGLLGSERAGVQATFDGLENKRLLCRPWARAWKKSVHHEQRLHKISIAAPSIRRADSGVE
jgi:hypothetical protein